MKKILWIIATIAICFLYIFLSATLFLIGGIIVGIITRTGAQGINQDIFNWVVLIGILVLVVMSTVLYRRWIKKCPVCKRWNAMKLTQTKLLRQEDISVLMELEHRNLNGHVVGTHDQYIPGKRNTFMRTYQCKHCGHIETDTYKKDRADI